MNWSRWLTGIHVGWCEEHGSAMRGHHVDGEPTPAPQKVQESGPRWTKVWAHAEMLVWSRDLIESMPRCRSGPTPAAIHVAPMEMLWRFVEVGSLYSRGQSRC